MPWGKKTIEPADEPMELMPSERDFQRAEFHVERFTRAIEQCVKGDERLAELQANLAYWQKVLELKQMRRP